MAHSPEYWFDFMNNEKNSMPTLSALTPIDDTQTLITDVQSTSKVGRWRAVFWVIANCAYGVELIADFAIRNMEKLAANRYGTKPWFVSHSLKFQYGDTLTFQNDQYSYPVIDATKQIIKRAACKENGNTVNLLVAKLVGGVPAPLSALEKTAYIAYIQETKPPGTDVNIISDPPDEARFFFKVIVDPLLLDLTGQLLSAPGTYPAHEALNAYISNLGSETNFSGKLELFDLFAKMKQATGVVAVYDISSSARYGANPFVVFTERYESHAGHLVVDPANPLTSTIQYEAANV
jgi:hypothetical protein